MCATEAKYHKRCLTSFYNKFRNFKKSKIEPSEIHIIEGIALAGVIKWVKDAIEESFRNDVTPVFEQKELVKLYNKLLILNGAPSDHVKKYSLYSTNKKHFEQCSRSLFLKIKTRR